MARTPTPRDETPIQKFDRVASKRFGQVVAALRSIGQLGADAYVPDTPAGLRVRNAMVEELRETGLKELNTACDRILTGKSAGGLFSFTTGPDAVAEETPAEEATAKASAPAIGKK